MHGQQNDKYTEMHCQQNDKYTEMHGQQNDKYTEMHGQQNVKMKFLIDNQQKSHLIQLCLTTTHLPYLVHTHNGDDTN